MCLLSSNNCLLLDWTSTNWKSMWQTEGCIQEARLNLKRKDSLDFRSKYLIWVTLCLGQVTDSQGLALLLIKEGINSWSTCLTGLIMVSKEYMYDREFWSDNIIYVWSIISYWNPSRSGTMLEVCIFQGTWSRLLEKWSLFHWVLRRLRK